MPRPKSPPRKHTATYLDAEETAWLDALARRDGLDAAAVLRMAFRRHARAEGLVAPGATENAA